MYSVSSLETTIFREIILLVMVNFKHTFLSLWLTQYFATLMGAIHIGLPHQPRVAILLLLNGSCSNPIDLWFTNTTKKTSRIEHFVKRIYSSMLQINFKKFVKLTNFGWQ